MKKMTKTLLSLLIVLGFAASVSQAQIQTPRPSPMAKIEQEFGLGSITLDFSRPSMKDRKVFGDLVPYGKIWRTGANGATKITFSDDVKVEGKDVAAGTYALYSIPGESEWTFMLYKDLSLGGNVNGYDESKELTRFKVKAHKVESTVETMTINVDDLRDNSCTIYMIWEHTWVGISVETDVDAEIMKSIERAMAGTSAGDYYTAALYYYNTDRDMNKAVEWITKADEGMSGRYWVATWKARILAKAGKTKEAMAASEAALKLAETAGNNDYVKINKELMAELKKK